MTKELDAYAYKTYFDSLSKEEKMDEIVKTFAEKPKMAKERSVLGELWHGLTWWVKGDPW